MAVVVCCPTTVTLPAAEEVVWLMGTDVWSKKQPRQGGMHTHRQAPLDRDTLGLENLGEGASGLLGRVVGKAT